MAEHKPQSGPLEHCCKNEWAWCRRYRAEVEDLAFLRAECDLKMLCVGATNILPGTVVLDMTSDFVVCLACGCVNVKLIVSCGVSG